VCVADLTRLRDEPQLVKIAGPGEDATGVANERSGPAVIGLKAAEKAQST